MSLRSPVVAMLWEHWRLTRVEATQRLALGIVAGSAALVLLGDAGATVAFWILILQHGFLYFSIAKLNGGRFMDGYRPGFPLYLLYTRPVSTVTFVGVAMAYDALTCAALYIASAALLGFAFGQPLPLFSATVCLVAYHCAYVCVQYSTRSRVLQWIGATAITLPMIPLLKDRLAPPLQIELSLAENALMVLFGVVSFGLTVAGVARQRRGDVWAASPRTGISTGYPDWFVNLFRLPCPTSSATRAQVWFELKSSGLPVLVIGLASALLHPILFALSGPFDPVRGYAALWAMLSVLTVLALGGNAFGIRRKQGRVYATAFMATQSYGTARLAALKVLVRTTCLLVALIVVGVSLWTSSSLVSGWGKAAPALIELRRTIGTAIATLTGYELIALMVVAALLVTIMVAVRASLTALRARYPRQLLIASSVLLLYGLAFVARLLGSPDEPEIQLLDALFEEMTLIVGFVVTVATVFLVRRSIADQLLTLRHVGGAILVSAAFGAACVTLFRAAGAPPSEMPATAAVWMLLTVLLPLTISALAPWSLSRVRHT
jgi:hypothetical protein